MMYMAAYNLCDLRFAALLWHGLCSLAVYVLHGMQCMLCMACSACYFSAIRGREQTPDALEQAQVLNTVSSQQYGL